MTDLAFDTSVAIPYLVASHGGHEAVRASMGERVAVLTAQSLAETYSVLTRLPGDARLAPLDAVALIDANFGPPVLLDAKTNRRLAAVLAGLGVAGGAVYDALVALAARHAGLTLATRDRRAASTYFAVGVGVELLV